MLHELENNLVDDHNLITHGTEDNEAYQIESTEVSSFEFGRNPDNKISISNDHHSRL